MTEPVEQSEAPQPETLESFRKSFFYGERSNLNFKFLADLTDEESAQFMEQLLGAVSHAMDDGQTADVADIAYRWQVHAYRGHLGDPDNFEYSYDDRPCATMDKPLGEARIALITSSGHFVDGDDPEPLGVKDMSQQEAEDRIIEFIRAAPDLSRIPTDTPHDRLRVRHGGYPTQAAAADHQVALPLGHLRQLDADGVIGSFVSAASFVGATSQGRLRKQSMPEWTAQLVADEIDAVLLVPV